MAVRRAMTKREENNFWLAKLRSPTFMTPSEWRGFHRWHRKLLKDVGELADRLRKQDEEGEELK